MSLTQKQIEEIMEELEKVSGNAYVISLKKHVECIPVEYIKAILEQYKAERCGNCTTHGYTRMGTKYKHNYCPKCGMELKEWV